MATDSVSSGFKVGISRDTSLNQTARATWRAARLSLNLLRGSLDFHRRTGRLRPDGARPEAVWLQSVCQRVNRTLKVQCRIDGVIPPRGLIVCNHLSYLD